MRTPLAVFFLAVVATAQSFTVSPQAYARLEGPTSNTWPWVNAFRYQQVYTDLVGTPRVIQGIAWRRNQDQDVSQNAGAVPRTLDMEVSMCASNHSTWSTVFANNYVGTPMLVFTRKIVNAPDFRTEVLQRPAPFDFGIPLDTPYLDLGQNDLLYEIVMYSASSTASYYCDVPVFASATMCYASYASVGSGCTTARGAFSVRSQIRNTLATATVTVQLDVIRGPASASGAVLLGLVPLDIPIPGLCTNLYTDGGIVSIPFTTASTGTATTPALNVAWSTGLVGLVLTAQAAAADASQPAMPIAATQGIRCEMPPLTLPPARGARSWIFGATSGLSGGASNEGWLVTQFRH
jgi:hypothetical protein